MDGINETYVILVKRFLNSIQGSELYCALSACIGSNLDDDLDIDKDCICTWADGSTREVTITAINNRSRMAIVIWNDNGGDHIFGSQDDVSLDQLLPIQ